MGKLAIILCFILSVFPADATENRRHIHVVRPGSKRSHRGQTVAKIWIEENGEKKIEIAWSELSSNEERDILLAIDEHWEELNRSIDDVFAGKKIQIISNKTMCKYKDTNLGIKKLDFGMKRGAMAVYLTDGRVVIVPVSMFPDIKRLSRSQREDYMIMDDQYFSFDGLSKIYSIKDVLKY